MSVYGCMCERIPQKVFEKNEKEKAPCTFSAPLPSDVYISIHMHTLCPASLPPRCTPSVTRWQLRPHRSQSANREAHNSPRSLAINPSSAGETVPGSEPKTACARPSTYSPVASPQASHADGQTLQLKVDFKVDSIHIPATQRCAYTTHALQKATPLFRCPHRITTTSVW